MGLRKGQGAWNIKSVHLIAGDACCAHCSWNLSAEDLAALAADAKAGKLPDGRFSHKQPQPVSCMVCACPCR